MVINSNIYKYKLFEPSEDEPMFDYLKYYQHGKKSKVIREIKNGGLVSDDIWLFLPLPYKYDAGINNNKKSFSRAVHYTYFFDDKYLVDACLSIVKLILKMNYSDINVAFPDTKLKAAMTILNLFAGKKDKVVFKEVLNKYYNGENDERALDAIEIIDLEKCSVLTKYNDGNGDIADMIEVLDVYPDYITAVRLRNYLKPEYYGEVLRIPVEDLYNVIHSNRLECIENKKHSMHVEYNIEDLFRQCLLGDDE